MDIRMPRVIGLDATTAICADPSPAGTRVLILTTFETDEYVARALRGGAGGFLGKDVSADALLDGIRTIAVSPLTVRTQIQRAMTKLHARDRTQLVVIAYQIGLVRPRPQSSR
jgi:DNA-binding NarL/FixJ family response regulator